MNQTKADVINSAFEDLRISGLTTSPTADENEGALFRLEEFMHDLHSQNVRTDYNFEEDPNTASLSLLRPDCMRMAHLNLAMILVPSYNKIIPPELKLQANGSLARVSATSAKFALRKVRAPRRSARGGGNTLRFNRWQRYMPDLAETPSTAATNYMNGGQINDYTQDFSSYLYKDEIITSYQIAHTRDMTLVKSSNNGQVISYTMEAHLRSTLSNTGYQWIKILVETSDGRRDTLKVNFQLVIDSDRELIIGT